MVVVVVDSRAAASLARQQLIGLCGVVTAAAGTRGAACSSTAPLHTHTPTHTPQHPHPHTQQQASIFVQSHVTAHAELNWLLECVTPIGWLNRMIQFKEKARKQVGLLCSRDALGYISSFSGWLSQFREGALDGRVETTMGCHDSRRASRARGVSH
jgi:hypothetical protein